MIQKIKFRIIEIIMSDRNIMYAFGFKSEQDTFKYFIDAFDVYIEYNYEEFLKIFYERAKMELGKLFTSEWVVGGSALYVGPSRAIYYTTKNNYEYLEDDIKFQSEGFSELF